MTVTIVFVMLLWVVTLVLGLCITALPFKQFPHSARILAVIYGMICLVSVSVLVWEYTKEIGITVRLF